MAFNTSTGKQSFTAIALQTEFDFNFKIFKNTDILVYQTPVGQNPDDTNDILILTTNYTVTITGDTGGKVTLNTGATAGDTLVLQRNLPAIRETEYQTSGDMRAGVLNDDQDYQTYIIADNNLVSEGALRLADSAVGVDAKLPNVIPQYFLRVNAAGDGFEFAQAVVQEITQFDQANFRIFTGTKNISFSASAITAGQIRNITMADTDVDLADIAINTTATEVNSRQDLAVIHNMTTNASYTLTEEQNQYGNITITDTGVVLTTPIEIIMNGDEHTFVFTNDTLQDLTVKNSGGTGIIVKSNQYKKLRNDTVNVLEADIIGQNLTGIPYVDTDAIGANPTAKRYPDGTVVGSTDNGSYIKHPNGTKEITILKNFPSVAVTAPAGGNFSSAEISTLFPLAVSSTAVYNSTYTTVTGGSSAYVSLARSRIATLNQYFARFTSLLSVTIDVDLHLTIKD